MTIKNGHCNVFHVLTITFVVVQLFVGPVNGNNVANLDVEARELINRKLDVLKGQLSKILLEKGVRKETFDGLYGCLSRLSKELSDREVYIQRLKEQAKKIWVTNEPQTLRTKVTVDGNVRITSSLMAAKIAITRSRESTFTELERRLNRANKEIGAIDHQLEHEVVRKDRQNQVINGTVTFHQPITARRAFISSIRPSTEINGISLGELENNVLRKSGDQTVTGRWEFKSTLQVENLHVKGRVSGLNMSNLLLANSPREQVITGHFKVRHGSFNSLSFESINGIKNDELVLRSRPFQRITGPKQFTNVTSMADINLTGRLNGHNWKRLLGNSVDMSRVNGMNGKIETLRFATPPTIKHLTVKSVNDVQLDALSHGLTPEQLNEFAVNKTFRSLAASKVTLLGNLNGLNVDRDLVKLRSLANMGDLITFEGNVTFAADVNVGTINNVDLSTQAVRRRSPVPQIIQGTKIFDRSVSVANLDTKKTKLRHIDLDDLDPFINGKELVRRSNVAYEGKLSINGSLEVEKINGIKISSLLNSLWSRTRDQAITWPTRFEGDLIIDSLEAQSINGFNPDRDILRSDVNSLRTTSPVQVITGHKTFDSLVLGPGNLIMEGKTLNGAPFDGLKQNMIQNDWTSRKECFGKKTFTSIKVSGNIIAERVNGIRLEHDVMLANKPQNITGRLTFGSAIKANSISFNQLRVNKMNGYHVDEKLDQMVLHDQKTVSLENKDFRGGLIAEEIDLQGKINSVNLTNLRSIYVTLDSPQVIRSPLRFEDEVTFDQPIDTRSVNGQDLKKRLSDRVGPRSTLEGGDLKITGNVVINGNLITGSLKGYNPQTLNHFIVQRKRDNRFNRKVIFNSSLDIDYLTVDPSALIDGISPRDLIRLDQPISLEEPLTIAGNAVIDDRLVVRSGRINDCPLQNLELFSERRRSADDVFPPRPVNFTEVNILGNLKLVGSRLNGVNVDPLAARIQVKATGNQVYNSSIVFNEDVHVDELFVEQINGVDLRRLYYDSVRKTGRVQRVTGHKVFKSLRVDNGDVTFSGDVQIRGLVNKINVTHLAHNLVKPNNFETIRGRKIFYSDKPIVFHNIETPSLGLVNMSDLVLTGTSETIDAETYFHSPVDVDHLETRQLEGRQLSGWGTGEVAHFNDPVHVERLLVKRINGVPIENFVTTNRVNHLSAAYTFNRVMVQGDLTLGHSSRINGIDLAALAKQSISTMSGTDQYIPGRVEMLGEVRFVKGVQFTDGTLGDTEIPAKFLRTLKNVTDSIGSELKHFEDILTTQTDLLTRYSVRLNRSSPKLHFFDIFDDLTDFAIDTNHISAIGLSVYHHLTRSVPLSNSIHLWFDRACEPRTFSFTIRNDGSLLEKSTNVRAKDFPLTVFPLSSNTSIGISARTNLMTSNRCKRVDNSLGKSNVTLIYPLSLDGTVQPTTRTKELLFATPFTDIKYFVDSNGRLHAVTLVPVGNSSLMLYRCIPYEEGPNKPGCFFQQRIQPSINPVHRILSMELITSRALSTTLLSVLTEPIDCLTSPTILIFEWIDGDQKFTLLSNLTSTNPFKLIFIEPPAADRLLLAIAHNRKTGICTKDQVKSDGSVYLFQFSRSASAGPITHQQIQSIEDLNAHSLATFNIQHETYLVLASESLGETHIYKYESVSGRFTKHTIQMTKGVEEVQCYWLTAKDLFMIVTSSDKRKAVIYKAYLSGFAD